MKLPEVKNSDQYRGLYVVDFGDHCGVGYVAEEVAELLEREQFADVQVYKVHRANPDGTMELAGVRKETFQLESGLFFHAAEEQTAQADFQRLITWANEQLPPARCKLHLSNNADSYVTALIYPAEYDHAISKWLLHGNFRTPGQVEGGTGAVKRYYEAEINMLESKQLWPASSIEHLQGEALLEATNRAIVR